jgi:hypothetical protein
MEETEEFFESELNDGCLPPMKPCLCGKLDLELISGECEQRDRRQTLQRKPWRAHEKHFQQLGAHFRQRPLP